MKKSFVLLLVLVVLFSVFASVMADDGEESPKTLNWISARRVLAQNEVKGRFYGISDFDMDIWVPDLLTPKDDIPEDTDYVFVAEGGTAYVKVHHFDLGEDNSYEAIEEIVTEQGGVSDGVFWINGYEALIYENQESDLIGVIISFDDGDVIEFLFWPVSNPEVYSVASLIMSTIQPRVLHVSDVAAMMDSDLIRNWGPNKEVRFTDDEDYKEINVYMWDEGITSETIQNSVNWETARASEISLYNSYADVMRDFGMDDVHLSLQYISPDENLSFLTIKDGEIEYDFAE